MARTLKRRKFSKRAFKDWLDTLAKVCVKTRDDFTCQIQYDASCSGTMQPLDHNCQWCHIKSRNSNNLRWDLLNALCGCGRCHQWAHANPNQFGVWFKEKYYYRDGYINLPRASKVWREDDFREVESFLLQKAIDLEVDSLTIPERNGYRKRFEKKIKELADEQ